MSTLLTALALIAAATPGLLVTPAELAAAGITGTSKVMIYGSPMPASRLFFTLDYLGHAKVKMLNGGPLVSYCMVGMRASVTYFVARHLGYDARMYDGSIEDWTNKKLPARTGQ